MNRTALAPRVITELDHVRIDRLLSRAQRAGDDTLHELLDDADVVSPRQVPADVVTMYTQVRVEDPRDGTQRKLAVCYPEDAEPGAGFVSVLSPIGTALLGRRRGETVAWTTPNGGLQTLRIVELLFQPEASGDFTL
ncbi:MAG: nucleoside diphosphate kinase regulator [Burkholderiaceae bacterium]|nr:nucleoside diphosphate kinase regulator [Burkholderiaceae bacterium]